MAYGTKLKTIVALDISGNGIISLDFGITWSDISGLQTTTYEDMIYVADSTKQSSKPLAICAVAEKYSRTKGFSSAALLFKIPRDKIP